MHLTAAEWARIEALFPQLSELPAQERAGFLDRECADEPRVRCELEAMLAVAGTADALLDGQVALSSSEPPRTVEELPAGTRMGSWKIKTLIGHGGMGEVYLAERADGAYAMSAAIKLLKKELFSYANAQRFLRERRVLARLSHPNIARVLDAGTTDDGRPYLVMEYVHGTRVTDYARARHLPPDAAARLMLAVAEAVAEAHRRGVVHRDLKPANVMVDGEQQVKLLDFGIARLMDEDDAATPGMVAMTPAYAAPEQVRGETPSPAADVYALGVVLFQLLTQRLPHTREGMPLEVILAGLDAEAPEPPSRVVLASQGLFPEGELRRRADAIADGLDPIVLKALRANPGRRYANAGEFAEELRRWLDRRPAAPRRDSALDRARGWLDRLFEPPPAAPAAGDYRYWAFISYSHQDENWARWLHTTLETWRVPRRLVGRPLGDETIPRRLFPVFRDRDELPSSHELGAVINQALRQSRNLIVVCSPRSATSRWVNEEVKAFRALGRGHRVFCLIVDGEPNASARPELAFSECFPPALREEGFEPIAADARARKDGKAGSRLKLLAGILDVGLDELKQREKQRQLRQRLLSAVAAIALAGVLGGTVQWFLRERAAREHQIAVEQLVEAGRLELLEGRQARAAVLLHEALRQGHDTVPLRFMLGQAMLPVDALGDVRVRHGGTTVRRALFSPDGARFVLIVAKADGSTVGQVYDATNGAQLQVLQQVPAHPRIVQFIGDGSLLLVAGYSREVEQAAGVDESGPRVGVWRLTQAQPVFVRDGEIGRTGTPVLPDGSVAIGTGEGIAVVDAATGAGRRLIPAAHAIVALSYSGDGRYMASADATGRVELRVAPAFGPSRVLRELEGQAVVGLTFAPDQKRLLALSAYGDVRIWDVDQGTLVVAFAADPSWVSGVTFSGDGRRLLTVGSEGFKVWSAARGVLAFDVRNAIHRSASAALSPDGEYVYVADDTSSIAEIWGVRGNGRLQTLELHANSVSAVALDATGERLLLASKDGTAAIWRARTAPAVRLDLGTAAPARVLWTGDDDRLVVVGSVSNAGLVTAVEAKAGKAVASGEGHRAFVAAAALSADRRKMLTAGFDGIAGIWDAGTLTGRLLSLDIPLTDAGLTPDGTRGVVIASREAARAGKTGFLIDVANGTPLTPLSGDAPVRALALTSDGATLAAVDEAGRARLWNTSDGREVAVLDAHRGVAEAVVFNPSGTQVATSGHDHAVRLWPAAGGDTLAELDEAALGWVMRLGFSPDGSRLALGTVSGVVWIWEPASGSTLQLKGHRTAITSLSFLHGGELLLTAGYDGVVRAWDARSGKALAVVAALGGTVYDMDLTRDESRVAMGSPVTRLGGVWSIALESRTVDQLSAVLRCRVPWRVADGALAQADTPEHCR